MRNTHLSPDTRSATAPQATMRAIQFLFAAATVVASLGGPLALSACNPDVRLNTGNTDNGDTDPGECGDIGRPCCTPDGVQTTSCNPGTTCGHSNTCCAQARSTCAADADCCGNLTCDNGQCFMPEGGACGSSIECKPGLLCGANNTCQVSTDNNCGFQGGQCCQGAFCNSGNECINGSCQACGTSAGALCCAGATPCTGGLVCGPAGTCMATGGTCGSAGQSCCEGGSCGSGATCNAITNRCEGSAPGCQQSTCLGCVNSTHGCGWCDDGFGATCKPGSAAGPTDGFCSGTPNPNAPTQGAWTPPYGSCANTNADPCSLITSCGSCTTAFGLNCGWCDSTRTCQNGNAFGPTTGFCPDWDYSRSQCTAGTGGTDPCAQHNFDCGGCLTQNGCGFCASTGYCISGNPNGPVIANTCANTGWVYQNQALCPPNQQVCQQRGAVGGCAACIAPGGPDCTWCADGYGSCIPANQAGNCTNPKQNSCWNW